jgi:hypothetical protein
MLEKAARKATEKMDNREKGESEQKTKSPEKKLLKMRKRTRKKGESEQEANCKRKQPKKQQRKWTTERK